jgi:multicomponent Na+:H+ antiporter subunit D
MPLTTIFCLVGAASISAFPLFSGFISKSLIMSASGKEHYQFIWLVLVFASAGVLSHSGIKVPFFIFFHHDSGKRPQEAPVNMLLAMALTAVACIYIGINPNHLYSLLPYQVQYQPYTIEHIITQLQLLCFAILAFYVLYRFKQLPSEKKSINLDFDWIYRKGLPIILRYLFLFLEYLEVISLSVFRRCSDEFVKKIYSISGPNGITTRIWASGSMVLCVAFVLMIVLGIILI